MSMLGVRTSKVDYSDVLRTLGERPVDSFRRFYADTAMFGAAAATRCGLEFFGSDRVLFASDMPFVEVFSNPDPTGSNPLGVKGVGEVGQVGSSAAIANAVYHATGYRVRELPIAIEHLLAHLTASPRSAT